MARKTSKHESRIWSYGCLPPTDGAELLDTQLRNSRRYQNKRVELKREELALFRAMRAGHDEHIAELETEQARIREQIEQAYDEIKARRQREVGADLAERKKKDPKAKARKVRTKYPELEARIGELKERAKLVREQLKQRKDEFRLKLDWMDEAFLACREARNPNPGRPIPATTAVRLNEEVLAEMLAEDWPPSEWKWARAIAYRMLVEAKEARRASGLTKGCYDLADAAFDAACKAAFKRGRADGPRFAPSDGTGRVGVHLSSGLPVEQLGDPRNQLIRLRDADTVGKCTRGVVDIRVNSGKERVAQWASLPVRLHRPLPPGAIVKDAWILVRREGPRRTYQLQLSLEMAGGVPRRQRGDRGWAALHLAWRQVDGQLRAGYVVTSAGDRFEVAVPEKVRDDLQMVEGLSEIIDRRYDEARAAARAWFGGLVRPEGWLCERMAKVARSRAPRHLAAVAARLVQERGLQPTAQELWRRWREERIPAKPKDRTWKQFIREDRRGEGGLDLFAPHDRLVEWFETQGVDSAADREVLFLEWWRRKNSHLEFYRERLRKRALAHRKCEYRRIARALAARFEHCIVDPQDLASAARLAAADAEYGLPDEARAQRVEAAPSELRSAFREAFGADAIEGPEQYASSCSQCGSAVLPADGVFVRCERGHRFDRDENAALNLAGPNRERSVANGGG